MGILFNHEISGQCVQSQIGEMERYGALGRISVSAWCGAVFVGGSAWFQSAGCSHNSMIWTPFHDFRCISISLSISISISLSISIPISIYIYIYLYIHLYTFDDSFLWPESSWRRKKGVGRGTWWGTPSYVQMRRLETNGWGICKGISPQNMALSWICLRGPQKIKNIHDRVPQMVDFLLGK